MKNTVEHQQEVNNYLCRKASVLIIDDSIDNIQTLTEILHDQYRVLTATSGQEGIEKALGNDVDLILLDIKMPGMDGYEVCRQLKNYDETREIGVVFVTAMHEIASEAKGLDLGAIDYIVKPFSLRIIEARIRNHIELVRHRKRLKSLSLTDGLTGLPNRRHFDQELKREWHRCQRQHAPLTVMLIDIDRFKNYNDQYGHLQGDVCLQQYAQAINACRRRKTDLIARFGGEEFAAVFPETDHSGAMTMAKRILLSCRALEIACSINGRPGIVTASIGLSSSLPDSKSTPEDLVNQADKSLYEAKAGGRNRIVAFSN